MGENKIFDLKTIILIIIIIISWGVLFWNNVEVSEPDSIKERTETYLSTCENWEICDYKTDMFCPSISDCKEKYQCWWESRDCNSSLKEVKNNG